MKSKCDYLINLSEQSATYLTAINNSEKITRLQSGQTIIEQWMWTEEEEKRSKQKEDEDKMKGKTTNTVLF